MDNDNTIPQSDDTNWMDDLMEVVRQRDATILKLQSDLADMKVLVKTAFETFHYVGFAHNEPTWGQFCEQNNITP